MANPRRIFTQEEKELLIKEYVDNKKSLNYCSKILHSNANTIKKQLIEMGVKVRNREEALLLSLGQIEKRKYPANDSYFSTPNEKMAYLIGFIAADGNLSKKSNDLTISLAPVDREFLEKIYKEIGGRPIRTYQATNGHDFCSWSCASKQIRKDLEKYNIIPNKTFSFTFPENLPYQYWKDFIRGYFDGDGSIFEDANGIRFSIGSANKNVLEVINQYFFKECGIKLHNINERNRLNFHTEYTLRYRTQDAITIFYHIYYQNCKLYLPRKYEKYRQLIDKRKTSTRLHIPNGDKELC